MPEKQAPPTPGHYQQVPYPGVADPETQIRGLESLGVLFGIPAKPVASCRVLELGCAAGRNLLPQAAEFPASEFQGLDCAAAQIAEARSIAAEAGLSNVQLHDLDIQQLDSSRGRFDYLLCPGVFSWVPEPVQDRILAICREHLAPGGIAVITHNVYPGWHFQAAARDLMRQHVAPIEDPQAQIAAARSILDFAAAHCPPSTVHGQAFRRERDYLRTVRDDYLYHDYLVDQNHPLYFQTFMRRAQQHGLQLVCDANLAKMSSTFLGPEVQQVLAHTPLIQACQLLDFLRNESFHKTLLCHAELPIDRSWNVDTLKRMHLILIDVPQPAQFESAGNEPVELTFPIGKLTTRDPLGKAAMLQLIQQRPHPVSLPALHLAALNRLATPPDYVIGEAGLRKLAQAMSAAVHAGLVKAYVDPPRFCASVSRRPVAHPLVRAWSRRGQVVVNQLHENIQLGEVEAFVAARLDGTVSRDDLAVNLAAAEADGRLSSRATVSRTDPIETALANLAASALLIG